MRLRVIHIYITLCVCFFSYSFIIYQKPYSIKTENNSLLNKAITGRLVFQKYNCQSCHQFYGLGGYLGPDLTNVYSKENKGELLIRAMVANGSGAMPAYNLSEQELENLIEFLRMTDKSGYSDPRSFKFNTIGTIERK